MVDSRSRLSSPTVSFLHCTAVFRVVVLRNMLQKKRFVMLPHETAALHQCTCTFHFQDIFSRRYCGSEHLSAAVFVGSVSAASGGAIGDARRGSARRGGAAARLLLPQ